MEPLLAIVNPAAAGGRCGKKVEPALARLRAGGLQLEVRETASPGHAPELVREAVAQGHTRFLAVGGDGSNFEVLNGLFPWPHAEVRPTLGTLPLGTGNSFLRDFGVLDAETAFAKLLRGETRTVDVIRCEHAAGQLHYLNILGLGFAARVGAVTNRWFKWAGARGYIFAVLVCLLRMRHPRFPLRLDGGSEDDRPTAMLSFCNSKFTGGDMMMAPAADAGDGRLDVIRVGRLGRWRMLRTFPKIFAGTHVDQPGIEASQATRVDLRMEAAGPVMVDGEIIDLQLRALQVLPGTLDVIA